jgi:hypothetical protein
MPEPILCQRCGQRRARRACPALHADICSICCGTEREVSLSCPLDCQYLREGHQHEKTLPVEAKDVAAPDIDLTEDFVGRHQEFLLFGMYTLLTAALQTPGAVDSDVLEALDALIKTYRTAESGLIYESHPENLVAFAVQRAFTASLAEYSKNLSERRSPQLRDKDILCTLVFLRRFGQQNLNGRPRGRMFLDVLRQMTPEQRIDERAPSIIL